MVLFDFQQVKSRSSANSTAATDVSPTVPTARSTRTCTRPTSRTTAKCAAATSRTRIHHRYVSTWKCTENLLRLPVTTRMPTPSTPIATLRRRRRLHRHRRRLFRTTTTFSSSNSSSSNSSSIRYLSGTFVKVRRACRRHRRRSTRPSALWLICTTPSLLLPLLTDLFYVALLSLPAFIITKLFLPPPKKKQKQTKKNRTKKITQILFDFPCWRCVYLSILSPMTNGLLFYSFWLWFFCIGLVQPLFSKPNWFFSMLYIFNGACVSVCVYKIE